MSGLYFRRALLLCLILFSGFLILGYFVLTGRMHGWDTSIFLAFRNSDDINFPFGSQKLQEAMRDFTSLGGRMILTLITATGVIYFLIVRQKVKAAYLSLTVIAGTILGNVLKARIGLPRPDLVPHSVAVHSSAFPSAHTLTGTIVFMTFGLLLAEAVQTRIQKIFILAVSFLISFLIGFSRVYLGVHWPSDVMAGWLLGGAWTLAAWLIFNRLGGRKKNHYIFECVQDASLPSSMCKIRSA